MSEVAQATREPLVMFAIYEHPTDYPNDYVVRRLFVFPGEEAARAEIQPWYIDRTLEAVRTQIPPGMFCLGRCEGDDPKILETWL